MSEVQLLQTGFFLMIIAAAALIFYLILSLIMLLVKKKNEVCLIDKRGMEFRPYTKDKASKVVDDTDDLENKIIGSTEALANAAETSGSPVQSYRGFLSKDVREIIIPKERMVAVRKGTNLEGVLKHMITNDISQCPVYYRSIDDILGVVKMKALMKKKLMPEDKDETWDDCIETPPFISSSISIQTAFNQMRQRDSRIAIVIDEYAQTIGIITEDDIVCGILNDNQQK